MRELGMTMEASLNHGIPSSEKNLRDRFRLARVRPATRVPPDALRQMHWAHNDLLESAGTYEGRFRSRTARRAIGRRAKCIHRRQPWYTAFLHLRTLARSLEATHHEPHFPQQFRVMS